MSAAILYVADANKQSAEHVSFNAAMLQTLFGAAREHGCKIVFFSERTHREAVLSLLAAGTDLEWHEIPVVSGFHRTFIKKFVVELVTVCRLIFKARRAGADVLLLSVFPNVLACVLLLKPLFRNVRLHVILHGELESLVIEEKRPIWREGFWVRLAVLRLYDGKWPSLYVLGEGIRSRLMQRFAEAPHLRQLRVIEHPHIFLENVPHPGPGRGVLCVGFVGAGRVVKGIEAFFRLAEALSDRVRSAELEFVVIGGMEEGYRYDSDAPVRVLCDHPGGLSVEEYRTAIASLDCAVFLFKTDYLFTASGSVFDVLDAGVPILSLENQYLRDLARDDCEGGMTFFEDLRGIEMEIRRRLDSGMRFPRRAYPRIRWNHSTSSQAALVGEIFAPSQAQ
ncbi:MAG TPA: hypothetical protein VI653_13525 [Steroidobacteraceae bacterium]